MKLNEQQEIAANHRDGPCLCTAVPGSGKTRVIVERVARMVEGGIAPNSILCITFTNKAATEMKERVEKRVGETAKKIFIATFHRLASTVLRHHGHWIGYDANMTILDEDDQVSLMLQTSRQMDHELTKPEVKKIVWMVNDWRENLGTDDDLFEKFEEADKTELHPVAVEYLQRINKANMIDFSGMLSETYRLLKNYPQVLEAAQKRWKYFMVDEVQDTNLAQFKIVDLLCNHTKNIFVVGDLDQCQPSGTMVLTTSHGEVAIENLNEAKHKLVSFSSRSSAVLGRMHGLSFKKATRTKCDWFRTIHIADKETVCTSNHKWTVRLKREKLHNYHAVYLQKKGDMWRVGRTAIYRSTGRNGSGQFGPSLRGRQEGADAAWILKLCSSAVEAQTWEQIISCRYGIPTVCFNSNKQFDLPTIYDNIVMKVADRSLPIPLNERVGYCLANHKLLIDSPFWERRVSGISQDFGKRIPFCVAASNLIPEIMQIPVPTTGKEFEWMDFSITTQVGTKTVYSLDVERHEHYIADGIITHNSIYGWRGARSENVKDFQKEYGGKVVSLGKNYRSTPQIIAAADRLIRHNGDRIAVDFSTDNPDGAPVVCRSFGTDLQEADAVAKTIKQIIVSGKYGPKDIAVFYRMNSMSRAIEMAMITNQVAHNVIGNFSFFDRKEIKDCMAMLRFLVNPKDGIAFHRIANKPKRSLGDTTVGKIEMYAKTQDVTIMQAMKDIHFTSQAVKDGLSDVLNAYNFDPANLTVAECLSRLVEKLNYEQYLKDEDEEGGGADRIENIQEFIRDAARYSEENGSSVAQYLDKIALMTSADKADQEEAVSLMSGHASKGLEFPVVFIVGAEHGILPHKKAVEEREDGIEEERRLCYVMMTRAKNILSVTYCHRRQEGFAATKGQVKYKTVMPSQFLVEAGLVKALPKPKESQAFQLGSGKQQGVKQTVWDHMA